MTTKDDNAPVSVAESTYDLHALIATFDDDPALRDSLEQAQVLIIPSDLAGRHPGPAFPIATREFFRALQAGLPDNVVVEAAVSDDDYREFEYRSIDVILPDLFITAQILLPLVLSTVGSWIATRLTNRNGSGSAHKVKQEIHVKLSEEKQIHLKYEGPADTYEKTITQQLQELGAIVNGGGTRDE